MLTLQLQELSARDDDVEVGTCRQQVSQPARSVQQVLEVVQQEQHAHVADERPERLLARPEGLSGLVEDEARIAHWSERHPEDTVGILVGRLRRSLQRQPCLAGAAGAGEGEQANIVTGEQLDDLRELALAADERRRRHREIRAVERLQDGEVACTQLVDALGGPEVLEAVLAEIGAARPRPSERRRRGDEHLAPVAGGGDAGRAVDVAADVALRRRASGVPVCRPIRTWIGPACQRLRALLRRPPVPRVPSGTRRRTRRPACPPRPRPRPCRPRGSRAGAPRAPPRTPRSRAPSSSFVEPSTSVKRNVTVPAGRSLHTARSWAIPGMGSTRRR